MALYYDLPVYRDKNKLKCGFEGQARFIINLSVPVILAKQHVGQARPDPPVPVPHVFPDTDRIRTMLIKPGDTFGKPFQCSS